MCPRQHDNVFKRIKRAVNAKNLKKKSFKLFVLRDFFDMFYKNYLYIFKNYAMQFSYKIGV